MTEIERPGRVEALFAALAEPFTGEALFDALPDVVFFLKDRRAAYVAVNQTLADRCAGGEKGRLLGRTAADVFPEPFGRSYLEQDREVMATGRPLIDRLELHVYPSGATGWCLTQKLALPGRDGRPAGLVGVSRDLSVADAAGGDRRLAEALAELDQRDERPATVQALARRVGLSRDQLDRRIRRLVGLSAGQFLLKRRLDRAVWLLRSTEMPIAEVALECGYSEQSAFSRQFRKAVGVAPARYRRAAGGIGGAPTS
jgi:AraC-like DNA-binding protein